MPDPISTISDGETTARTPLKRAVKSNKKTSASLIKMRLLNSCSGVFFAIGAYGLIDPQSAVEWLETGVVGFAGGLAAYSVNHICMTKGVQQAAIGVTGSLAVSLTAMAATGLTISLASLTGMTINPIDQMRMQEFGAANTIYVEDRITAARQADQVVIAVDVGFEQIQTSAKCERTDSCVSLAGRGGKGPAYFTLKATESRIGAVVEKMKDGGKDRDIALEQIEASQEEIQAVLSAAGSSRKARRADVQRLLSDQNKALAALDRAQPLSLASSLAEELQKGVELPGKPVLSERINERTAKAASGIVKALEQVDGVAVERPKIPPETGVMETLDSVGHYLFLATMLVLIDLVFPLLLLFFTYIALLQTVEPDPDPGDDDPFSFSNVADTPPIRIEPAPRQAGRAKPRKNTRKTEAL